MKFDSNEYKEFIEGINSLRDFNKITNEEYYCKIEKNLLTGIESKGGVITPQYFELRPEIEMIQKTNWDAISCN